MAYNTLIHGMPISILRASSTQDSHSKGDGADNHHNRLCLNAFNPLEFSDPLTTIPPTFPHRCTSFTVVTELSSPSPITCISCNPSRNTSWATYWSRNLPNKSILIRDTILGFADGLTVPFALCAGLSSLNSSRLVVLAGLAELFSGAISMGLGCYLAAVTEAKGYEVVEKRLLERFITRESKGSPRQGGTDRLLEEGQCEHEIYEVLEQYDIGRDEARGVVRTLSNRRDLWTKFMLDFSLKTEKPLTTGAWVEGLTMGLAYFIGGLLPMLPCFITTHTTHALIASIVITAFILLLFGHTKSRIIGCTTRDNVVSAVHTLGMGFLAAGVSYGIVRAVNSNQSLQ